MICKNCNTQLADTAQYCPCCGAPQHLHPYQQPAGQNYAPPYQPPVQTTPKKKNNWVLPLVIAAVCFLIGSLVIAPALSGGSSGSKDTPTAIQTDAPAPVETIAPTQAPTEPSEIENPAYTAIFSDRWIVTFPPFFPTEGTASFAKVDYADDGTEVVIQEDYGYDASIVAYYTETYYWNIENYTDDDFIIVEAAIKESMASFDALECCTVTCTRLSSYYKVTLEYENINKSSALAELYSAEITSSTYPLSIEKIEEDLLANGYVKK